MKVLEVGSKSYHAHDTFHSLFPSVMFDYIGLDISEGDNVNFVPKNIYVWDELPADQFDVAVSGQTFEHNPYFWATFCEMARVLKPGGLLFVVAPGGGAVHRYPYDCWRFYPDSWPALAALSGLTLLESYFECDTLGRAVRGGEWRDSAAIARKPVLPEAEAAAFNARLESLVAPYASMPFDLGASTPSIGEAFTLYRTLAPLRIGHASRNRRWRLKLADMLGLSQPITGN